MNRRTFIGLTLAALVGAIPALAQSRSKRYWIYGWFKGEDASDPRNYIGAFDGIKDALRYAEAGDYWAGKVVDMDGRPPQVVATFTQSTDHVPYGGE